MPRGRGGRRQGTPGKGYTNRTDLATNYQPQNAANTAASGGVTPPPTPQAPAQAQAPAQPTQPPVYPEDIPKLDDPTGRPNESVLTGLRGGPQSIGKITQPVADPNLDAIRAAYNANPTPQLGLVLRYMSDRLGRTL